MGPGLACPISSSTTPGISTYVWVVTNRKPAKRAGKVQLINGTDFAWKMKKEPRRQSANASATEQKARRTILKCWLKLCGDFQHDVRADGWRDSKPTSTPSATRPKSLFVSKIFSTIGISAISRSPSERPLRLNFAVNAERLERFKKSSAFIDPPFRANAKTKRRSLRKFWKVKPRKPPSLDVLDGMKPAFVDGQLIKDRAAFDGMLTDAFKAAGIDLEGALKAHCSHPAAWPSATPARKSAATGKETPEPDADLRDTENVPFRRALSCRYRLTTRARKTKARSMSRRCSRWCRHCEEYLKAEMLPYRPGCMDRPQQNQSGLRNSVQSAFLRVRAAACVGAKSS